MKDMGNIRPQGLRDIESLVWSMVLKIARGEAKAPEALEELMSAMPWNIVEAWGPEDPNRTWSSGQEPNPGSGSHRDVNMEDEERGHNTRTPVPRPGDKEDSTMTSADAGATSGPQEGDSDRDVTMEDIESCPEPETTAPGLEDNNARTTPDR